MMLLSQNKLTLPEHVFRMSRAEKPHTIFVANVFSRLGLISCRHNGHLGENHDLMCDGKICVFRVALYGFVRGGGGRHNGVLMTMIQCGSTLTDTNTYAIPGILDTSIHRPPGGEGRTHNMRDG